MMMMIFNAMVNLAATATFSTGRATATVNYFIYQWSSNVAYPPYFPLSLSIFYFINYKSWSECKKWIGCCSWCNSCFSLFALFATLSLCTHYFNHNSLVRDYENVGWKCRAVHTYTSTPSVFVPHTPPFWQHRVFTISKYLLTFLELTTPFCWHARLLLLPL